MSDDARLKAEIFQQKVPCQDCPFRKEGGVAHPPERLLSYASYFLTVPGATFPCHKSVPKTDDRDWWSPWQDGQVICAGGLLFAAKHRRMNAVVRHAVSQGWYNPSSHTPEELALVVDSLEELLARDGTFVEDVCKYCGTHLGWGVRWLHLGVCDDPRCQSKGR